MPSHKRVKVKAASTAARRGSSQRAVRQVLPFVLVNMSMTADGKIATTNRAVSSFGSRRDHDHLLALRATADAVMCGARTADLNPVNLGPGGPRFQRLRRRRGLAEFNLRVLVSGSGSLSPEAHIFSTLPARETRTRATAQSGPRRPAPIIILTTARAGRQRLARLRQVADEVAIFGRTKLDLRAALSWLRRTHGVRRLVCEGGGELNAALFRAGLVDELHLTVCPRIIGGREAPTIADGKDADSLAAAHRMHLASARRVGDELFLVFRSCKSRG